MKQQQKPQSILMINFPGRPQNKGPPQLRCTRCGWKWTVKKKVWIKHFGKFPDRCPKCHHPIEPPVFLSK